MWNLNVKAESKKGVTMGWEVGEWEMVQLDKWVLET